MPTLIPAFVLLVSMNGPGTLGTSEPFFDGNVYGLTWHAVVTRPDCAQMIARDEVYPGSTTTIIHTCGPWECREGWAEMQYLPGQQLGLSRVCVNAEWKWGPPPDDVVLPFPGAVDTPLGGL